MTRQTFMNDAEDIQWLLDVHLSGRRVPEFKSAVVVGNEDCPDLIEIYADYNPHYLADPVLTFDPERDAS